jgi:ligand-binding sensor domain-containing protein
MPFYAEVTEDKMPLSFIPNEHRNEQSLTFETAYQSFEDKEQNIWIATDNGVFLFNPDAQIFNSYNLIRPGEKKPVETTVLSVKQLDDEKIFVATQGFGIFCFDNNLNPAPLPSSMNVLKHTSIYDMAVNPKTNELWMSLKGGSVGIYNHEITA